MVDLKSKKWIVAKGLMLVGIALATAALIFTEMPSLKLAVLLTLLVWASCRFYYFLFYVLEHYVDRTMRYAGLLDLLMGMRRRREQMRCLTWLEWAVSSNVRIRSSVSDAQPPLRTDRPLKRSVDYLAG